MVTFIVDKRNVDPSSLDALKIESTTVTTTKGSDSIFFFSMIIARSGT